MRVVSALPHMFLTDTIHTYRSEVDLETDRLLAQTETDLNKQLNHIIAEFGGQLNIADYQ